MKPMKNLITSLTVGTTLVLGFTPVVGAVTILSTDFTGRTISGATASSITWTTNGVASPGSLTATASLFDTTPTQNLFAVNQNLQTVGPWSVDIPIVVGAQAIQLSQISLDAYIFTNLGDPQSQSRDFDMTIDLLDSTETVLAAQAVTDLFPVGGSNPSPVPFIFDFSGNTIAANTNYFLRLTASTSGTLGVNGGFDNFLLTGDLVPTSTPEPGSLMALIGLGCLGITRKLTKKQ